MAVRLSSMSPTVSTSATSGGRIRRSSAATRATSSLTENGLVT